MGGSESKVVRHLVLQRLYLSRVKFDHSPAACAYHVIVMLMIIVVFIISLVVAKSNLTCQSGLSQQF